MKIYIGIKDGKIWDLCSELVSKRTDFNLPVKDYLFMEMGDFVIGDSWDSEKKESLKDSPKRFEEPPKSKFELLKEKVLQLEQDLIELKKAKK